MGESGGICQHGYMQPGYLPCPECPTPVEPETCPHFCEPSECGTCAELAAFREAAFREGAEAMRECIVYRIWGHEWRDPDDLVRQIRALPLPEVK